MPTIPGTSFPNGVVVTPPNSGPNIGASASYNLYDGYLFANGDIMPEIRRLPSILNNNYYATKFCDLLRDKGGRDTTKNFEYSWSEYPRTRRRAFATNFTAAGGGGFPDPLATIELDNDNYYLQGDTIIIPKPAANTENVAAYTARIVSVVRNPSPTPDVYTIRRQDGVEWQGDEFGANSEGYIGHMGSNFGEMSRYPESRWFTPYSRKNRTSIIQRTVQYTRDALLNKFWLKGLDGKEYYIYNSEMLTIKEMNRDAEITAMFSRISPDVPNYLTTASPAEFAEDGVIHSTEGVLQTLAGHQGGALIDFVDPTNLIDQISDVTLRAMVPLCDHKEWLIMGGVDWIVEWQRNWAPYVIADGGKGRGAALREAGFNVTTYQLSDWTMHIIHYDLFDDVEALGADLGDLTYLNWSRGSVWFNLGKDTDGKPLVRKVVRENPETGIWGDFYFGRKRGLIGTSDQRGTPTIGNLGADNILTDDRPLVTTTMGMEFGMETRKVDNHRLVFLE